MEARAARPGKEKSDSRTKLIGPIPSEKERMKASRKRTGSQAGPDCKEWKHILFCLQFVTKLRHLQQKVQRQASEGGGAGEQAGHEEGLAGQPGYERGGDDGADQHDQPHRQPRQAGGHPGSSRPRGPSDNIEGQYAVTEYCVEHPNDVIMVGT